jgi:Flp pilus assembly protein CpaB
MDAGVLCSRAGRIDPSPELAERPMSDPSPRCACPFRNPVLLLAILLAVTTTGWVVTALNRERPAAPAAHEPPRVEPVFVLVPLFGSPAAEPQPAVEMVAVPVAAKDLPVGTVIRKAALSQFVARKMIPKDSLPPQYVTDEAELADKRLTRAVLKNETFAPSALSKDTRIYLPDGMDLMSLSFSEPPAAGFVVPGSRVDIITTMKRGNRVEAFKLLDDVLVLAVDSHLPYPPDWSCVLSFAVDEQMAMLVALAKQAGCKMEVLLRAPGKPATTTADEYKKRAKLLQEWLDTGKAPVAPAPRAKGE